jgi:hypothetical protein
MGLFNYEITTSTQQGALPSTPMQKGDKRKIKAKLQATCISYAERNGVD